jgi:hypothetical protein
MICSPTVSISRLPGSKIWSRIPTGDLTLSLFGGQLPLLGLEALLTGASLSI